MSFTHKIVGKIIGDKKSKNYSPESLDRHITGNYGEDQFEKGKKHPKNCNCDLCNFDGECWK